jgi:hypothetical protein
MGGSVGKSSADSSSAGSFGQNVWGGQTPYLQNLYQQAGNLFGTTSQGALSQAPWASQYASNVAQTMNPAFQQQLQGGAYAGLDAGQIYGDIAKSMQQPTATQGLYGEIMSGTGGLPLAREVQRNMVQNASDVMGTTLAGIDARAAGAGLPGSSRHGIAQGQAIQGINKNLQQDLAQLGYQAYEPNLQRQLGIASQADQSNLARQQMLTGGIAGQQAAMTGAMGYAPEMQALGMGGMAPYTQAWGPMGMYSQALGGPQVLSSGNMSAGSNSSSKGAGIGGLGGIGG